MASIFLRNTTPYTRALHESYHLAPIPHREPRSRCIPKTRFRCVRVMQGVGAVVLIWSASSDVSWRRWVVIAERGYEVETKDLPGAGGDSGG